MVPCEHVERWTGVQFKVYSWFNSERPDRQLQSTQAKALNVGQRRLLIPISDKLQCYVQCEVGLY